MKFVDSIGLSEKGVWVHIKDRSFPGGLAYWSDDEGNVDKSRPVRIKLLGPDSPTLQELACVRVAERYKSAAALDKDLPVAQIVQVLSNNRKNMVEDMADATIAWENVPGADGEPMEFSHDNAMWLYGAYPSILRQVRAEAGDIDSFLATAAKS